jgi:hypothetical protein
MDDMHYIQLRRQLKPALPGSEETSGIIRLLDPLQSSQIVRAKRRVGILVWGDVVEKQRVVPRRCGEFLKLQDVKSGRDILDIFRISGLVV